MSMKKAVYIGLIPVSIVAFMFGYTYISEMLTEANTIANIAGVLIVSGLLITGYSIYNYKTKNKVK